ncbi:hypothetical protein BJV74DRAFT_843398 [Russula compacta]|nr:hypothetical protein BJV74DRAFT_843398 [Russula compacta]
MSTDPPIPPNIAEITAPLLLGTIWNWCLFGALVVQFYVYTYNFSGDKMLFKLLVYSVFFLETLQTALSGADVYYWFVTGFGNMNHLASPYASAFDVPIIGSVVSLSVQFFFVYRIWVLGKKETWWLCFIICLVSTVDALAAFTGGTYVHVHGKFATGRILKILATIWLAGNTVSDMLIAAAMVYHVVKRRAGNDRFGSHALLSMVILTVETNIMTTTGSVVSLLMVVMYPEKNWYVCPTAVLGKLYSNTLLVSLNNRISIRNASVACGGVVRTRAGTFPSGTARSDATMDIMLMGMEKAPQNLKIHSLRDSQVEERVIDIA